MRRVEFLYSLHLERWLALPAVGAAIKASPGRSRRAVLARALRRSGATRSRCAQRALSRPRPFSTTRPRGARPLGRVVASMEMYATLSATARSSGTATSPRCAPRSSRTRRGSRGRGAAGIATAPAQLVPELSVARASPRPRAAPRRRARRTRSSTSAADGAAGRVVWRDAYDAQRREQQQLRHDDGDGGLDGDIPPLVHSIWDDEHVEKSCNMSGDSWRKFCARHGCEYKLWRRADIEGLARFEYREHYEATVSPQGRADIARLEILRNVGGLYLDCDLMWAGDGDASDDFVRLLLRARGRLVLPPSAPVDVSGVVSQRPYERVSNRVLAAPPWHRAVSATLALLPSASFLRRHLWSQSGEQSAGPYWITGPHPLSLALALAAEESAYPGEPPELAEAEPGRRRQGRRRAAVREPPPPPPRPRVPRADAAAATAAMHSWVYPSARSTRRGRRASRATRHVRALAQRDARQGHRHLLDREPEPRAARARGARFPTTISTRATTRPRSAAERAARALASRASSARPRRPMPPRTPRGRRRRVHAAVHARDHRRAGDARGAACRPRRSTT